MNQAQQIELEEKAAVRAAVKRWHFVRVNDRDLPRRNVRHFATSVIGRPVKDLCECSLEELRAILTALQQIRRGA